MGLLVLQDVGRKKKEEEAVGADFEPWSAKRGEILARFTTTEKLSIVSHKKQTNIRAAVFQRVIYFISSFFFPL